MTSDLINTIFKEPTQWGLRGDPHMWDALKKFTLQNNPDDFMTAIHTEFDHITSTGEKTDDVVFIKDFAMGGMTSGSVSLDWFNETGFPLLKDRYETLIK